MIPITVKQFRAQPYILAEFYPKHNFLSHILFLATTCTIVHITNDRPGVAAARARRWMSLNECGGCIPIAYGIPSLNALVRLPGANPPWPPRDLSDSRGQLGNRSSAL